MISIFVSRTVLVALSRRPFHWTFMPGWTKESMTFRVPFGVLTMIVVDGPTRSFFVPTMTHWPLGSTAVILPLLRKLEAHSRLEAVRRAEQAGLI